MRALIFFVALMALAIPASARAQEGHPLVGTWYGDYEANKQKRDLTIILKWDGKIASGTMNPGPNAVPIKSATLDITPGKPAAEGRDSTEGTPPIFKVTFEADGRVFEGTILNPVAGNRQITGTWSRGAERGTFHMRRL